MELTDIVPDGPKGFLIQNKQFITYLTKSINLIYSLRTETSFPAPQPVSMEKKDFAKLKDYIYSISLKLDGTRFLMYFIRDRNNRNQCILINRALQFFSINMNAENEIYNGTLIDGELIMINDKWVFMVHDSILLNGKKINKDPHTVRLDETNLCLESYIGKSEYNTVDIQIKKFYPFEEIETFISDVYNNNDNNDGIIFMPENLPVISGTQYSMLKWKPHTKHTFDFLIKENENILEAHVFYMGDTIKFANIHYNTEDGKDFIDKTKLLNKYTDECILECSYNIEKTNFVPILIRTDKTHPNSLRTIERTLYNIGENITIDDFISLKLKP